MQANNTKQLQVKTQDKGIRWFGYTVLFITFGLFGGWAVTAPLDSAALASGFVSVKYSSKTVQHLEGGIIDQLYVNEGSYVQAGDVLIHLDETQIRAQLDIAVGQLITYRAEEARLLAQMVKKDAVEYSEYLQASTDPRAKEAIQVQNQIFKATQDSINSEKQVLQQRIQQLGTRRVGLQAQKNSNVKLQASLTEEISEIRELLKDGFADKQRLRERERELTNVESRIAEVDAELASIQVQIGETQLQIIQLEKRQTEEVTKRLSDVQSQIFDANERFNAANDRLKKAVITAPVTGTVLGLMVHTIGGVVTPGTPIMDIVPEGEELTIVAQVSPIDIDRVAPGQVAEIRFSSFSGSVTPRMFGDVIHVSPDRFVNDSTGHSYYEARLEVTKESMMNLNGLVVLPGMPVEVMISSGERTLFEYMTKPITDAFKRSFLED